MFRRSFSSEDSELSESVINSKSAIRVSICLQRYFKDVRARCYLLVARNRRVRWLEKRIQKIFALPGNFCLCSDGHLLPSSEPLALLRPEDSIEVIPLLEAHTDISQENDALVLNEKNQLEKDCQNEEKQINSSHKHVRNSASKYHQMLIDETNCNENAETADGNAMLKPQTYDDIDSARTLYSASSPVNSSLTLNNNNDTASPGGMNGHYKPKDTSHCLQQFKRRALALLDAQCGAQDTAEAEEPPRRARRRVRRRTRRAQAPEAVPAPELEPEPESYQNLQPVLEPEPVSCLSTGTHSQSEPDPPADARVATASPQPQEVARNESACSRKPRVVRSLDVEI